MQVRYIKVRVRIVIEPDDKEFYAYCPELKGVHAGGATEDEAVQNAKDAAQAYIMSLVKNNDPLPLCADDVSFRVAWSTLVSGILGRKRSVHSTFANLDVNCALMGT